MEKVLFDKNHVKVTVCDKYSSSSKYRIAWATANETYRIEYPAVCGDVKKG